MKNIIRRIYALKYGCRGGLRPPLGFGSHETPTTAAKMAYQYRRAVWVMESRIYKWTGLPKEWAEFRGVYFVN
jgi:hypothetical protein